MVPQVGQRIGPYEILGRLGTGGMGLVFSAWDGRLQRDVAIKILRDEYATPEMRSRFLQEARAASGLNHPNICTIFDIGEQDGDPFLVMELLKGETLRNRINAGDIQLSEIVRVGTEVADALSTAHARGIVHRDIKPANIILVDKPGGGFSSKVLDFGLAKVEAYGESIFDLTHTGTTVGTVAYMSPEQARGEQLDPRSDLFSLGVILYEMATGRVPFHGATSALVFVELLSREPALIRDQNPGIPSGLELIIHRLLEKDRTLRFQDGQDVVNALAKLGLSGSSAVRATPLARRSPMPSVAPPALSSRQIPIAPSKPTSSSDSSQASLPPTQPAIRALRQMERNPSAPASSTHRIAKAEPAPPKDASKDSSDDFIRPVRRVLDSESAVMRAAFESSAFHNIAAEQKSPEVEKTESATPVAPKTAGAQPPDDEFLPPQTRLVAEGAEPAYDPNEQRFAAPSRPIVPQSARKPQSRDSLPVIHFPRQQSSRPAPRFSRIEEVEPADILQPPLRPLPPVSALPEAETPRQRWWLLPFSLVFMAAIGFVAWQLWPHRVATDTSRIIPLALLSPVNTTGDSALSGALSAGILFDLAQSPQFLVEDQATLDAGLQSAGFQVSSTLALEDVRRAAQSLLVTELLQPAIHRNGNAYVVSVRIIMVGTGAEAFRMDETAQSREQVVDAIDRLVVDLRTASGEVNDDVTRTAVPLSREASSNLDALNAYTQGTNQLARGQFDEASTSLEHATSLDSHFAPAWLQLADLYRRESAEVAAAQASTSAQTAASRASNRMQHLAAATFALNVTGDLNSIASSAQAVLADHPHSVRAHIFTALSWLEQGKFSEAGQAADGALSREPYDVSAHRIGARALIGQERFGAALAMLNHAGPNGAAAPELKLLLTWLQSNQQGPIDLSTPAMGNATLGSMQASLLAALGDTDAAYRLWQGVAAEAGTHPPLFSTAGNALSHEALDMALLENCGQVPGVVQSAQAYPLGPEATFRSGLASALCGNLDIARKSVDKLNRTYPESYLAKNSYIPSLQAVIQWKSGDSAAGLHTLLNARQADIISFAPYLRGLIHLKAHQSADAVAEFQLVLQHGGSTALVNPVLYPLAQLGLARAYNASGDHDNSAAAYAKYLQLIPSASASFPLAAEARNGSVH